jgi:hypothetical protein
VDDSGSQVIIAAVGDKDSSYDDFLAALPDTDCRYGGARSAALACAVPAA